MPAVFLSLHPPGDYQVGETEARIKPNVPIFDLSLGIFSLASVAAACGRAVSAEKWGKAASKQGDGSPLRQLARR